MKRISIEELLQILSSAEETRYESMHPAEVTARIREVRAKMIPMVRELLDPGLLKTDECGNDKFVPRYGKDWRPVDRVMGSLWTGYTRAIFGYVQFLNEALTMTLDQTGRSLDAAGKVLRAEYDAHATALWAVMQAHFELMADYGQDGNADLYYDRMINKAVMLINNTMKERNDAEPGRSDRQDVSTGPGDPQKRKSH